MGEKICPYPGLRPFTQEESIFFKGRDMHIRQVISQLEERKFVLVTGASGDGKSSLVYAGVIPNAMAGFFHAEYSNWVLADFRPERDPLGNLAEVLASRLSLDPGVVRENMQHGFSAVVNLYKSSSHFIDKRGKTWVEASEQERKHLRSRAANLLILADQFEEFFTNTENYSNGKASHGAYTTVNLLLETARIAIQENLPIYVILTMRSDFISQCVAFKHLPEMMGFSQFFVPRLKRNELQQVIEEPARLAGGKIAKRLVEILINELREGFDQLPVLQHCLNSLWHAADNGNQEINFIHLAKVAGIEKTILDEQDLAQFEQWLETQDDSTRVFYEKPSLANVLNTHANMLYGKAYQHFKDNTDWAEKSISHDEALLVIKTTFQCLTRIDGGRSVRNRMSLDSIARIINRPNVSPDTVCGVMNIFRLPSNTFIRPFIDPGDIATQYLPASSVWDITHESLIRNWELLRGWEAEEEQYLLNFHDFETQLHRWVDSGKSPHFLLSPGSLSHFEEWHAQRNLNAHWLVKYDSSKRTLDEKMNQAKATAMLTTEFLGQSRHFITRIERKKRYARRVAFTAFSLSVAVLAVLSFWALREKANAVKQGQIAQTQENLAQRSKKRALWAQKEAEKNAEYANIARAQSEKARLFAEKMGRLADEKIILAYAESQKALFEKQRADQQLAVAQEQKSIADQQRTKAEDATGNARRLSFLATAQALSFKAEKNYNDGQINLLLAYHAYLFNHQNGGNEDDPDIFQALTAAQNLNAVSPVVLEPTSITSTLSVLDGNKLACVSRDGRYSISDIKTSKVISGRDISSPKPVNQAFILGRYALTSCEDMSVTLWGLAPGTKQQLAGHTNYVRAAIILNNKNILVTGCRDKCLRVYELSTSSAQPARMLELDARVTKLAASPDEKQVYAACSNGDVVKWDMSSPSGTLVFSAQDEITGMVLAGKMLVTSTAGGRLVITSTTDNSRWTLEEGHSKIDAIAIDEAPGLLAVSSADKTIRVYHFSTPGLKPYFINRHNQRATELAFDSGKLYALCADNKIRCWETSVGKLAAAVHARINRELTHDEWNNFVGKDIEYQTAR